MMATLSSNPGAAHRSTRAARLAGVARLVRARARLISGLVLLSFVLCHLVSHIFLIVSLPVADEVLGHLMMFWWTGIGTCLLATALAVHVLNALWSIFIRRYLRLPVWELAQLILGLSIPPLIMLHVVGTKISDHFLGTASGYHSVLAHHWVVAPWLVYLQIAAVLTLWTHACIGLHFWLRTKRWYPVWRPILGAVGVLIPALALAGYISGGNQILREAQAPGVARCDPKQCQRNAADERASLAHGVGRADGLCRPCHAAVRRARRAQHSSTASTGRRS